MDSSSVVERSDLRGYGVEWSDENRLIASKGSSLYEIRGDGAPRTIATISQPLWKRAVAASRLGRRALRYLFYNVLPLPNGELFVTFGKQIAVIRDDSVRTLAGLARPFRVLRGGCALCTDGSVLFGEYVDNAERGHIRLYRYWPGAESVEVAFTFPKGQVRHVHGVYADPFSSGVWCLAGDKGAECRIVYSDDGFRTHDIVGCGDETWRTVSIQFSRDAVFFGMDAEFRQNVIFRMDRRTRQRDVVCEVEGPVYYSAARGAELYFGVTAELCPSQQGDFAAVWRIDAERGVAARLATFRKDGRSPTYFMPGTLDFARSSGHERRVLFRTTGLMPDNAVFEIR